MSDYRSRLVRELYKLDTKIAKLEKFLDTPQYERLELRDQRLLLEQHASMVQYRKTLSCRVAHSFELDYV
ncbi:hypothetical protein MINTMi27_14770 [Mycobacterium intracellulare]|uniref:crAss001_48 related protein n=1 Tax=Mycobacterium intracellulare TaxID=1767 RepID=UPI0019252C12|nr:hypothetical protein [Mycobacterium intracellulare]BCP41384.1 hypothetical protein MINTMi27_14770 [Mycobacterium intracellulare]